MELGLATTVDGFVGDFKYFIPLLANLTAKFAKVNRSEVIYFINDNWLNTTDKCEVVTETNNPTGGNRTVVTTLDCIGDDILELLDFLNKTTQTATDYTRKNLHCSERKKL